MCLMAFAIQAAPGLPLLLAANRMAAGDMSQTLDSDRDDLLGQFTRALNQLGVNLRSIVADARAEVDRMRSAAREIAAGNHDLSARTETQAANLQRTASSMTAIPGPTSSWRITIARSGLRSWTLRAPAA